MARKDVAKGEAPAPTPAEAPGQEPEGTGAVEADANEETFRVVVNPRLDAAEYVAPDGRRFGRDGRDQRITQADYDELTAEHIGGFQPIVKEK